MVQIKNCFSQSCEISNKSDLRRSLDTVDKLDAASGIGNQESGRHNEYQLDGKLTRDLKDAQHNDFGEKIVKDLLETSGNDGLTVKRCYSPDEILALKESPLAKIKPDCVDDKPYWIGNAFRKYIFCFFK